MYFIIDKNTRAIISQSQTPFNVNEAVQPADPQIQLKRVDDPTQPAYDPATQKLVQTFADDDVAFTRTFKVVVQPLSAQEQADYQQGVTDEATRQQLKAAYSDLVNGVGTATQRIVRIEKSVAWLLRQYVKN